MDQFEFSIAIHLVRKKLQGAALPKVLPASLKADPVKPGSSTAVQQASQQRQTSAAVASQAAADAAAAAAAKATHPAQVAKGTASSAPVCSPPLSKISHSQSVSH